VRPEPQAVDGPVTRRYARRRHGATLAEQFIAKVEPSTEGCWTWTASVTTTVRPSGYRCPYGQLRRAGRLLLAHRVSWELHAGPVPEGMRVLHRCDNPRCVRPDHLFLGTQADNVADARAKGWLRTATGDRHGSRTHPERRPRGERSKAARLDEDRVREIRALAARGGLSQRAIARRFGVGRSTVRGVVARRVWRHVGPAAAP
jgi:hypothetical protein